MAIRDQKGRVPQKKYRLSYDRNLDAGEHPLNTRGQLIDVKDERHWDAKTIERKRTNKSSTWLCEHGRITNHDYDQMCDGLEDHKP